MTRVKSLASVLALVPWLVLVGACGPSPDPRGEGPTWLVIGIDGADWSVIEDLWDQGKLPHLRALADRGVAGTLGTSYGESPVIWTTVATGVVPKVHGITGFVIPTPQGDVPVSSGVRRVPALWNMLTTAGRRVAVLSWWASWPAEQVAGVIVTDRAEHEIEGVISPPELAGRLAEWRSGAASQENLFDPRLATQGRDHLTQYAARQLLELEFDLMLVYFRGVDIASHHYWKYYRPEEFSAVTADREDAEDTVRSLASVVPDAYEATDEAIGRLVARAGGNTNVLVLSDHGFFAQSPEKVRIFFDLDAVLAHLGFLERRQGRVDLGASRLYTFATAKFRLAKKLKYGPSVAEPERAELRTRLTQELAKVSWAGGEPVFRVRGPGARDARDGADLMVDVSTRGASRALRYGDETWDDVLGEMTFISGTHGPNTRGVVFAAGPDVEPAADIAAMSIHDITPTLLYGLGLPVAEDFAGRAWQELFTNGFRASHPLRTVASWGTLEASRPEESEADEAILDDLRALGYID